MTTLPQLSVVLPVYNAGPFLKHAVQSVLDQTYADFEIIAINDGSTDQSLHILQEFTDPRLRVYDQENQGLIATLRRGVDLAQAPLIARMDQDDQCLPHRFAAQIAYMNNHREVGVCGGSIILDENGRRRVVHFPTTDTAIRWRLCFTSALVHPTVMFRKSVVLAAGNYRQIPEAEVTEDYDLWTRVAHVTHFANIHDPVLILRKHGRNMTSTASDKHLKQSQGISKNYIQSLLGYSINIDDIAALRLETPNVRDARSTCFVLGELYILFLKKCAKDLESRMFIENDVAYRLMWIDAFSSKNVTRSSLYKLAWQTSPSRAFYYFFRHRLARVAARFHSIDR